MTVQALPIDLGYDHASLRIRCTQYEAAERVLLANQLAKLRGGRLHPYRRLWASERRHMPDIDVAAAGGWKDTRSLKLSYQQADPATVLKVVNIGAG